MQQKFARTARHSMWRRGALVVAATLAVGVAAATAVYFAVPGLVPEHRMRAAIAEHVGAWTVGDLRLHQLEADVSFSGGPVIAFENAVFSGVRGGRERKLEADSIEATLETLPLLWGQIEIKRLVLDRPRFWSGDGDAVTEASTGASMIARDTVQIPAAPRLGEIILSDASIVQEGTAGLEEIRMPDLRMAAVPESTAVLLSGGVLVGERLLRIGGRVEDPAALLTGSGSNVRLVLRDGGKAEDGDTSPMPPPPPDVPAIAEVSEVRLMLRRASAAIGLSAFGPVAIEGRFALTPRTFGIADATLTVNGFALDGDLSILLKDKEPFVTQVDQVVYDAMDAWRDASVAIRAGEWREVPLALGWLAPLDITLDAQIRNYSADPADPEIGRVQFATRDARARLKMKTSGDLGRLEADVTVDVDPTATADGAGVTAKGRVDDVALDKVGRVALDLLPPPLVSPPPLPEGTLDVAVGLVSQGATLGDLVSDLDGSLVVNARDGSLAGADVVQTLERLTQSREFMSEEDGPLIPSAGRTMFDTIKAHADLKPGAAHLTALHISGDRYVIEMSGDVDLRSGEVRAEGQAVLLDGDADLERTTRRFYLPFGSGGTLAAPVVAAGVPRMEPVPR